MIDIALDVLSRLLVTSLFQNKLYFLNCDGGPGQYSHKARRIDTKLKSFISEYQVVGSCNGLICIADALYFNLMIVCNPFAGNFVELPRANEQPGREVAVGFGFRGITLGIGTCRSLESLPLSLDQNPSEALLNRVVHWVTTNHKRQNLPGPCLKIISFDLAKETFIEIQLPTCGLQL